MNDERLSRRRFLKLTAGSMVALAAGSVLIGCGDDDDEPAAATPAATPRRQADATATPEVATAEATTPVATTAATSTPAATEAPTEEPAAESSGGGTVRIGGLAGAGGPIDPRAVTSALSYLAVNSVFEFAALHGDGELEPGAAESITSNEDATVWTLTLREGLRFHDGSPVRAQDVVASIAFMGDFETSPTYALQWIDVDWANLRAIDDRTVEVPLLRPRADYLESVFALYVPIIKEGTTDFMVPIGSGPYKVESNDGADGIVVVRNDDWWEFTPSVERVINVPINDPAARINALKSGEIDIAYQLPPAVVRAEEGNDDITVVQSSLGGAAMIFSMNTSLPPFDNPEVREALRLSVDRQTMINSVLLGQGQLGNDLVGLGFPGYNDQLPQRTHDLERAQALFAANGISELDILASDVAPGLVASAEVLAAQLAAIGVTLNIEELPADAFFADIPRLLNTPFMTMYFSNRPPSVHLPQFVGSTAVVNVTAFATPEFDAAMLATQSTTDEEERLQHLLEAQAIEWEQGGTIVWGFSPMIIAHSPRVENVKVISDGLIEFEDLVLRA
ncbi:MAG: ABC transporter substrate-binding protein [bacterium]|nr:ABC transporter substrate-binding protein [bacterium]